MQAEPMSHVPPAPEALRSKLQTVLAQHLLAPDAQTAPPSPCVSVCRMDAAGQYCEGCLRTLNELRIWGSADAATQRAIWLRIQARCTAS